MYFNYDFHWAKQTMKSYFAEKVIAGKTLQKKFFIAKHQMAPKSHEQQLRRPLVNPLKVRFNLKLNFIIKILERNQ